MTGLSGFELKRVMRTGTIASIDNRNWELGDHVATIRRLSQSRAIALDMESAAVAANGFRFRVPYGSEKLGNVDRAEHSARQRAIGLNDGERRTAGYSPPSTVASIWDAGSGANRTRSKPTPIPIGGRASDR